MVSEAAPGFYSLRNDWSLSEKPPLFTLPYDSTYNVFLNCDQPGDSNFFPDNSVLAVTGTPSAL